jgi:hypothetical protein
MGITERCVCERDYVCECECVCVCVCTGSQEGRADAQVQPVLARVRVRAMERHAVVELYPRRVRA